MKKILISSLILILTFFSLLYTTVSAREKINCLSDFKDVLADTPMCFYTSYLDYQRVITGYKDMTFREDENLTRGQMAKFISNAFQIPDTGEPDEEEAFPDVNAKHTFYKYINNIRKVKIVEGYSNGNYKPDEPVTREQITKFLANAIEYKDPDALLDNTRRYKFFFNDISEDNEFYDYLNRLYVATQHEETTDQIIDVPTDLKFRPKDNLKRGEMAKMITNAMFYTDVRRKISLPVYSRLLKGIDPSDNYIQKGYEINHYAKYGLTVLSSSGIFDYVYESLNPRSMQEIAEAEGYDFIFNAGFFGAGYNEAGYSTEHAGLLKLFGTQYAPIKTDSDSSQLTHMIVYDHRQNMINFVHRKDYKEPTKVKDYIIFQSGPSVIMANRAEKSNIFNSKNGRVQRPRTLIGMTSNKEKHLLIFRYNYSLNEIADIMLHLNQFEDKDLAVINLDGGSSSAFYSDEYPELNFGADKRLPNLIAF
jgi:hypothetical protein